MQSRNLVRTGFALAIAGLLIACLSLLPSFSRDATIPWPLLVGSTVYILGGLSLAFQARGPEGKVVMGRLRLVRIGFIVLMLILVMRLQSGR